jgi:hypothetical protein
MKMTIVIADDSRTARFLIRQYLEMVLKQRMAGKPCSC